jgi:hypothetical protein
VENPMEKEDKPIVFVLTVCMMKIHHGKLSYSVYNGSAYLKCEMENILNGFKKLISTVQ